jgi:D-glycero-D-manno-heptose 1,7-bisphosphate phosphatase
MSLIFLDRDGTLIEAITASNMPGSINKIEQLVFQPGAVEGCKRLSKAGHILVLVTNQPDISRGYASFEDVTAINTHVMKNCAIDCVMMCPHDDNDLCDCRKPRFGMLTKAATYYQIELDRRSVIIGDRWRDIDCGTAAGISTIHVHGGHSEPLKSQPHYYASSMIDAAMWFLQQNKDGVKDA